LGAQEAILGRLSPTDAFYVDSIHTEGDLILFSQLLLKFIF
jgi:hypothetical protein